MNKRRTLCKISLFSIAFALLLISFTTLTTAAESVSPITTETRITTNELDQMGSAIYGSRIVWDDNRNGYDNSDIYMYDLSTSRESQITSDRSQQGSPDIYGDKIVWSDLRNGNWDIYMYNISTSTETRITADESDQTAPDIYGDRIVWDDWRNGDRNIYMYDFSTSMETRITNDESYHGSPAIYGDRIVWEDDRDGDYEYDIYMYDLSTKQEFKITSSPYDQISPAIYGEIITWEDERNRDGDELNPDIYMYDFSTGKETRLTDSGSAHDPAIYGDTIVWYDYRNGNSDIYIYDIPTSEEIRITSIGAAQMNPAIYGDRVVWMDNRNEKWDIYMATVSEEGLEPVLPVADLSSNVTGGYAPLSVQFTDLSRDATGWNWDFECDGIADSNLQNPVHLYTLPATYTVNLTVSNENGTDSKLATINVLEKPEIPVADFSASPNIGEAPLTVTFTDESMGSPTSWSWNFGDSSVSAAQNPVHAYNKVGKYTVSLTVENAAGNDTRTISKYIIVKNKFKK